MNEETAKSIEKAVNLQMEREMAEDAAHKEAVKNMSRADLLEFIGYHIDATDFIVEGLSVANTLTEMGGITAASVQRCRQALESITLWIETHVPQSEQEEESPAAPKLPIPKPRKVVLTNAMDDSEQL